MMMQLTCDVTGCDVTGYFLGSIQFARLDPGDVGSAPRGNRTHNLEATCPVSSPLRYTASLSQGTIVSFGKTVWLRIGSSCKPAVSVHCLNQNNERILFLLLFFLCFALLIVQFLFTVKPGFSQALRTQRYVCGHGYVQRCTALYSAVGLVPFPNCRERCFSWI